MLWQQFWANYLVVLWAGTIIVLNLINLGKPAEEQRGTSGPTCIILLILGALIYFANKNLQAYKAMKKAEKEF